MRSRVRRVLSQAIVTVVVVAWGLPAPYIILPAAASTIGTPSQVAFTPQVSNSTVGALFPVTVSVEDASGYVVTSDSTDAVTLVTASGPGDLNCASDPVTVSNGEAAFSCSIDQAGSYTLQATSGSLVAGTSSSFTVAGTPSQVAFTPQVSNSTVGALFPVTVSVEDASGYVVTSDSTDAVTLVTASGPGDLNCASDPVTVSNGEAAFSCSIDQAGSYTLQATSGSLVAGTSSSFTVALSQTILTVPGQIQIINVSANGEYVLYASAISYEPGEIQGIHRLDTETGTDLLIGDSGFDIAKMSADGQHVLFEEECDPGPGYCGDLLGGTLLSGTWYEWNANGDSTASYDQISPPGYNEGSYAQPALSSDGSIVAFGEGPTYTGVTFVLNVNTGISMTLAHTGSLAMTADGSKILVEGAPYTYWYEYSTADGSLIQTIANPYLDNFVSISDNGNYAVGFGADGGTDYGYVYFDLSNGTEQVIPETEGPDDNCSELPGMIVMSSNGQSVAFGDYTDGAVPNETGPYNGYFSYNPGDGQEALINSFSVGPWIGAGGICPSLGLSGNGTTAYLASYFPSGSSSSPALEENSTNREPSSEDMSSSVSETSGSPVSEIAEVSMPSFSAPEAPAITSTNSASGGVGAPLSFAVTSSGFPLPTLTESGSLPDGVSFNYSFGSGEAVIAGTPASGTAGIYPITITASNGVGTPITQNFTLTVTGPVPDLGITTTSLPNGQVGSTYSQVLAATGGLPSYTWSISSGNLPAGLTFDQSTGMIAGTPTATGTSRFAVEVADQSSQIATADLSITIGQGSQTISFTPPASGTVGGQATLSATGGVSGNPVVFSIDPTSGAGVCNTSGSDGSTVNYTAVGTCVIDANQAGDANYAAATQLAQPVPVAPAVVTVSISGSQVYGSSSPTFTETNNAPPGVSLLGSLTCTTVDNGTSISASLGADNYTLDGAGCSGFSLSDSVDYTVSYVGVTDGFVITPAPQTISFTAPASGNVGGSATLSAIGGASGNPVVFSVRPNQRGWGV